MGSGGAPSTLLDGLASYWTFDEASGNALDSVSSNHLTQVGTVSRGTGKVNNGALALSDANHFTVANNAELDLFGKSFSFSLWGVMPTSGIRVLLTKGTAAGAGSNQLTLGTTTSGATGVYAELGAGAGNLLISGIGVTAALSHVALTFNSASRLLCLYINNVKFSKTLAAAVPNAGGALTVGRYYLNGFSMGAASVIDEMGFWDRVLTDSEVTELYAGGGENSYPFDDAIVLPPNPQLIVLGDSTIAAYSGQNSVASYLDYDGDVVSLAVPGHTINQQLAVWNGASRALADVVCVQVGLNDLTPGEAASAAIGRLQALVNEIATDAPAARIMIGTMIPCRQRLIDLYGGTNGPIAYQKWLDMNEAISGAGSTPITGVDARATSHTAALNDGSGNLAAAFDLGDGIHENNAGREIVAASWQAEIDVLVAP
jgi:hypothetical protein